MLEHLLAPVVDLAGLTPPEAAALADAFRPIHLPRNSVWVARGSTQGDLGLIERGMLCYFLYKDGTEYANYLAPAGELVAPLAGLLHQEANLEQIAAVTDTRLWVVGREDFMHLVQTLPNGWRMLAQLLAYQIGCMEASRRDALLLTAGERYQQLLAKEPQLLQQAPLHHIAQVLGITPQHLSRLRRKRVGAF